MKLEELWPNAAVRGVLPDSLVTVIGVQWFGSEALELTYKTPAGKVANELLYRHDEPRLEVVDQGRPWSFDGDGARFRLVSEAHRIRLAHLFDPVLAVHTSLVEPLPHQITAVYDAMLPRQPLRFLSADARRPRVAVPGRPRLELLPRPDRPADLEVPRAEAERGDQRGPLTTGPEMRTLSHCPPCARSFARPRAAPGSATPRCGCRWCPSPGLGPP
jgi:hypothetical protein